PEGGPLVWGQAESPDERAVVVGVGLERRAQVGGACTLERPFADPGYLVSPCAYLVGLLHPVVIEELALARRGFEVFVVDPHLWCPFEDGTSLTLWGDDQRTVAAISQLAPDQVAGYLGYQRLFGRIRDALRPLGDGDTWLGPAPSREEIEERLGHDDEAIACLFEDSIVDVLDRYVSDDRLRTALHGQGIIGTFAGPRDKGTACVHWMHTSGHLQGQGGAWGYVRGGMGVVSRAIAGAALDNGAVLACGVTAASVEDNGGPGGGGMVVVTDAGDRIPARVVVSNADPLTTAAMFEGELPEATRARLRTWSSTSPVVKVNCGLGRLPHFSAGGGAGAGAPMAPHRAMVTISTGIDATQSACAAARRGEVDPAWCELYFHTAYDPSVAPEGRHVMSVFAQYAPYRLARGTWDERREEIGDAVVSAVARFAPDVAEVIEHREVLGPPDVEAKVGLAGGHIFQGECLPDQMWQGRFAPRFGAHGLYLCGASTHPGGSVIGVNGRNAAMAVLGNLGVAVTGRPAPFLDGTLDR
ncbi:MAG: phytoene desaturase family protein, partial [Acidimicrobiales bacterium]